MRLQGLVFEKADIAAVLAPPDRKRPVRGFVKPHRKSLSIVSFPELGRWKRESAGFGQPARAPFLMERGHE
jgi:hypothetical protein